MPFLVTYPEHELIPIKDSKGYLQVVLRVKGRKRTARVHRLVAECFLPEPSEELKKDCADRGLEIVVNHKDSNKLNNCVGNLEWCNMAYNAQHSVAQGTHRPAYRGSETPWAVLTESCVTEILTLKGVMSQQAIADRYGVKQITISNIFTGRSWAWFTGIKPTQRSRKKSIAICH